MRFPHFSPLEAVPLLTRLFIALIAGRGVTEAYDLTLTLHGATVIDGMTIQFKITDAYFNPVRLRLPLCG